MLKHVVGALFVAALSASPGLAQTAGFAAAQKLFDTTCAGCHGEGGAGGDRAPALTNNINLRAMNEAQIRQLSQQFEIGAHTLHHVFLTQVPDSLAQQEIADSKAWVQSITGRECPLFCPPAGKFKSRHLRMIRGAGREDGVFATLCESEILWFNTNSREVDIDGLKLPGNSIVSQSIK